MILVVLLVLIFKRAFRVVEWIVTQTSEREQHS